MLLGLKESIPHFQLALIKIRFKLAAFFLGLIKFDQDKLNFIIPNLQDANKFYAMMNKAYLGSNLYFSERLSASVPPDKFCEKGRKSSIFYYVF